MKGRGIGALVALAVAVPAASGEARGASSRIVTASVGTSIVSARIAPGFLGLSLEFQAVRAYTGTDPAAINPLLVQLIRNLAPDSPPVLRIGGDSTDDSWWPVRGMAPPPGIDYRLTRGWMRTTRALAAALKAKLILGVNLEANHPRVAAVEAREYVSRIGRARIEALEVGNEPDLYSVNPWYILQSGARVFSRRPSYSIGSFIGQFSRWRRALPSVPATGPALATPAWMNRLGRFLSAERGVRLATIHRYPLSQCEGSPRAPDYPSIAHLLSPYATNELARPLARYVAVARAHHAKLRVDEMNSVSCRGRTGVSNTFASALWVLDTLFAFARQGVVGVNIHTLPGAAYELFTFTRTRGRWRAFVHPEYYGLQLFAQAAPTGSRLVSVTASQSSVKIWATRDDAGILRVVLINEDRRGTDRVYLTLPPVRRDPGGLATLEWLRAPGLAATGGVTLGGREYGSRTTTSRFRTPPEQLRVVPTGGRLYVIELPAASAAVLTR